MTNRSIRRSAFAISAAVQIWLVYTYGVVSEWCFCAITQLGGPPRPPLFVRRLMILAARPAELAPGIGQGIVPVVAVNLALWYLGLLLVLYAMMHVAQLRVARGGGGRGWPRLRLARWGSMRNSRLAILAAGLAAAVLAAGAVRRQLWLAEAERVVVQAMEDAAAGRPHPPGIRFSMTERRGDRYISSTPSERYLFVVDRERSGSHFLDRFVIPETFGGVVRLESGALFEVRVYQGGLTARDPGVAWTVNLDPHRYIP